MIFWEKQEWDGSGAARRLTLWADGRSEITVKQLGAPGKPRRGWTVEPQGEWSVYTKTDALARDDARRRFEAAVAGGIDQLKTFPPGYLDGSGTLVGVQRGQDVKTTVIPLFLHAEQPDNQGSENHQRFLVIEKILGEFDIDAIETPAANGGK